MRNIKITVEYDGTDYCGWQIQNKKKKQEKTIQQTLERALGLILQKKIKVVGSGRTDSGAHALGQVANFKTSSKLKRQEIKKALNSVLPVDIRVKGLQKVGLDFHARFSARSKLYRYTIANDSFVSAFIHRYAYLVKYPLDVKRMRQAAMHLCGRHDFRSFQAADKKERHSIRKVTRLDIKRRKELIYIDIEAEGFLYKMVRNIVGTLVEAGRGRLEPQDVKKILKAKNRKTAGRCAPARGLCLVGVKYT